MKVLVFISLFHIFLNQHLTRIIKNINMIMLHVSKYILSNLTEYHKCLFGIVSKVANAGKNSAQKPAIAMDRSRIK